MSAAFPLPDTGIPETRGFWDAAAGGHLEISACEQCDRFVWFPRPRCPDCNMGPLTWRRVTGRGTLFSWAVVEKPLFKPFREMVPYVTGLVAIEEDPSVRLVALIVDCDPGALEMEMPLDVIFRELRFPDVAGEVTAPMFRPRSRGPGSIGT
jgi:uncharacterized OB-fold protein